jgi:DNA-binding protein YbaB
MTAAGQDMVEAAMQELQRSRERLVALRSTMSEASTTVSSKDKAISVTVDGRGAVTGIAFHSAKFRKMAPAELGAALVDAIAAARQSALERVAETFQPMFPSALPAKDVLSGKLNLDAMFADAIKAAGRPMPGEGPTVS